MPLDIVAMKQNIVMLASTLRAVELGFITLERLLGAISLEVTSAFVRDCM